MQPSSPTPAAAPATTSGQAMQNLQQFQSGMQTPEAQLQQAQQNLGVTAAQQQVQGLQGAIQNTTQLLGQVAPSVMGRTQNSLVTSAQANNQIGQEQAPIQANLDKDTTAYDTANTNYANLEQQAEDVANADQTSQQNQDSYLQNIYNDLYTQEQNASQQAEAEREFNVNAANSSSGTAGLTPTLGSPTDTATKGNVTKNAVGGYEFTDAAGTPITMGQYLDANGGTAQDAVTLLNQGSANDKAIAAQISQLLSKGTSAAQLAQLYPQVFGG